VSEVAPTRRSFARRALAVLAGALAGDLITLPPAARAADQRALLERAFEHEARAGAAYRTAARDRRLGGRVRALARRFAGHHDDHLTALSFALRGVGAGTPSPPRGVAGLRAALAGGEATFATLALRLEEAGLGACLEAQAVLDDPRQALIVGSIATGDAQHLVVLRELLGRDPLPRAFETGVT
jgi:Ferritin-like domain